MTYTIIGSGIGGLTLALLLEKKGYTVEIYEQAEFFKPIGAGIILAINAMKVYTHLGINGHIEEAGNLLSNMEITKSDFRTLSKSNFLELEKEYKTKTIAIHRGKLQEILLNNLKATKIYLNHKLNSITKQNGSYELLFENGKTINRSVLLGADGIHSKVREYLFPKSIIRGSKQACWRGITSFEDKSFVQNNLIEAWGKKVRFGFVPIDKNQIYWYALKTVHAAKEQAFDFHNMFETFDPLVVELIKSTPKEAIHFSYIEDLSPLKNWFKNNICLIGDAAHATTPNMGQGACQAIEDAFILSETINSETIEESFSAFQKLRYSKANSIVKRSWQIGKLAHLSNPFLVLFRDTILKLTPKHVTQKQLKSIFE